MKDYYITSHEFSVHERQTKTKGKVYDVMFRIVTHDGEEKQKKLSGYHTKVLAKAAYAEWIEDHAEFVKSSPVRRKDTARNVPTFGDLFREYSASLSGINKDSVIYDKLHCFELWMLPRWEKSKITELTAEELRRWQDDFLRTKNPRTGELYSVKYFMKLRSHLGAFLEWVSDYYNFPNCLRDVKKPARQAVRKSFSGWSHEEALRFLDAIDEPMWRCFFTMLYFTGRRKGELFALSPDDISETEIYWHRALTRKVLDRTQGTFKITTTKEDKEQRLPYPARVREAMAAYTPAPGPFYFGGDSPISETWTTYTFKRYIRAAGVPMIRMHDLRGSMATNLCDDGVNPAIVAELIGDSVEVVMANYYKKSARAVRRVVDNFI